MSLSSSVRKCLVRRGRGRGNSVAGEATASLGYQGGLCGSCVQKVVEEAAVQFYGVLDIYFGFIFLVFFENYLTRYFFQKL